MVKEEVFTLTEKEGRPTAATKEQVLAAISSLKSTDKKAIAAKLNCNPKTIERRMKEITQAEIEEAVKGASLKAAYKDRTVFETLPEIQDYKKTMLHIREVSTRFYTKRMDMIFRISQLLGVQPAAQTPEQWQEILIKIRKKELSIGEYDFRQAARSWFGYLGTSPQKLTNLGLTSGNQGENKSTLKLSMEQRHAFQAALIKLVNQTAWTSNSGTYNYKIDLNQYTTEIIPFIPEFLFYTGTRIGSKDNETNSDRKEDEPTGLLYADWSNVTFEAEKVTIDILDKGKYVWKKQLVGHPFEKFMTIWLRNGKPTKGKIFPFEYRALKALFQEAYVIADIPSKLWVNHPFHIWRHTAAQAWLAATDHNFETGAAVLGWNSTDVMKKCYGKIPEAAKDRALRAAMGLPVDNVKREFIF